MTFTRYSPRPLITTLNPAFAGILEPVTVEVGANEVMMSETLLALEWRGEEPALKRLMRHNAVYPLALRFEPAFPDIQTLADDAGLAGNFEIEGHPSTGRIAGNYAVEKQDGRITITLIPAGGWRPRPIKLSLRFLYMVAGVFRRWPATYEWTAHIQAQETDAYAMRSAWRRVRR